MTAGKQGSRRAVAPRNARMPLALAGVAGAAFLAAALAVPTAQPAGQGAGGVPARVARACFTTDAGARVGYGAGGPGAAQAPLAAPTRRTDLAAAGAFDLGKEPVRLSAPLGTGLTGLTVASAGPGPDQGLGLATCVGARSQHWFTGVRSNADARSELVLVNLDGAEAAVNVTVYGPEGELAAAGGRGVVVAGQSQRVLALGPLVDAPTPVTLHVTASTGRVAAIVRQRLFNAAAPAGADWIAPAAAPAPVVVVPNVPAGAGARTLVIANPDERTAQVSIEVLGPDTAYAPVGVEQVDVPAHSTRTFELAEALEGRAVALRLTGTRAVVAALEARTANDFATAPGAGPAGGSVPLTVPVSAGVQLAVTVVNPGEEAATVTVVATGADGQEVLRQSGEVAPGTSSVFQPTAANQTTLTVTSSVAGVRVGVAATGDTGGVAGLAVLALEDTAAAGPAISVTRDTHANG